MLLQNRGHVSAHEWLLHVSVWPCRACQVCLWGRVRINEKVAAALLCKGSLPLNIAVPLLWTSLSNYSKTWTDFLLYVSLSASLIQVDWISLLIICCMRFHLVVYHIYNFQISIVSFDILILYFFFCLI